MPVKLISHSFMNNIFYNHESMFPVNLRPYDFDTSMASSRVFSFLLESICLLLTIDRENKFPRRSEANDLSFTMKIKLNAARLIHAT